MMETTKTRSGPSLGAVIQEIRGHLVRLGYSRQSRKHFDCAWRRLEQFAADRGVASLSVDLTEAFLLHCRVGSSAPEAPAASGQQHLIKEARLLRRLDRFLAGQGLAAPELPRDLVRQWLAKRPHERPRTQAARAGLTRQLARFMADRGLPAYVPPPVRIEIARLDFTPHIFTRAEIRALLACVDRLPASRRSPRRHLVMPELFRVLYGCGLRISEALKLAVTDVDRDQGVLLVREGKFGKDRLVPVSPGLAERLRRYATALDRERDLGQAFFPKQDGWHYNKRTVYGVFRWLLRQASISHGGRSRGPRLHDLRHTYAVHRLEGWYRQGANLAAKLPVLSAYMGHQSLAGTQRYLRLTPALFPDVVASVEAVVGHAMPRREL